MSKTRRIDHNPKDVFIETLVKTVNVTESFPLQVTLVVGGTIISGKLISGKEWSEENAKLYDSIIPSFAKLLRKFGDKWYGDIAKEATEYEMIHLKDAKIQFGSSLIDLKFWRGRIRSIDGFAFGELEIKNT